MSTPNVRHWPTQLLDRGVSYLERRTAETMIQIEAVYAGPIDPDRLARAGALALLAEPILACGFIDHRLAPYWEEDVASAQRVFEQATNSAELEAFTHRRLDPGQAPRLRVCAWNGPDGARVVFKVCHHVCDASGVNFVVSLVTRFYRRLASHPGYMPVPRPSERGISVLMQTLPAAALPALYAAHLAQRMHTDAPQTMPIPAGAPVSLRFVARTLARARVDALRVFTKAHCATLNDLLLTAFMRTLAAQSGWSGERRLSITSTVDYRRYLPGASRSVANLSTTVTGFPDLGRTLGDTFAETLARVNAITRAAKDNHLGIGALLATLVSLAPMRHGLARSIMHDGLVADLTAGRMENGLGNNGPINADDLTLESAPLHAQMLPSPFYPPQFVVDVSGYAGTLTLILGTFEAQHAAAERFLDAMVDELDILPAAETRATHPG
jgi:NRPS condensation-like uncharacterized protein